MKKCTVMLILLLSITLFTSCDETTSHETTQAPNITAKASPTTTATVKPTVEPTATPDPYANDIMGYAIENKVFGGDGVTGDGWTSSAAAWWAPLQEGDGNATRTFGIIAFLDDVELSNGKEGTALSLSWNCDEDFERGQLIGLNYGLKDMLEADKVYKAVVTYKLTFGPNGPIEGHNTRLWFSAATESTAKNGIPLEETNEWKTAEYIFKTGTDAGENFYLQLGPSSHENMAGWVKSGFELLVERVSLTLYEGDVTFEK